MNFVHTMELDMILLQRFGNYGLWSGCLKSDHIILYQVLSSFFQEPLRILTWNK